MPESTISVIDLATQHGMRKQSVFKVLARLGIETVKRPGNSKTDRGQVIAYISSDDAQRFFEEIRLMAVANRSAANEDSPDTVIAEQGVFYLLQMEPDHDPGRFKVGFATSLPQRLRTLKCSAPFVRAGALSRWSRWARAGSPLRAGSDLMPRCQCRDECPMPRC